jgi:DNA repair exonuclease SbcCD nuclease subunit
MLGDDNAYDRTQKALYSLSHIVWEEKPDVVVLLGDMFDNDDPDSDELFLFNQFLLPIIEENIEVIIIPGNHDSWSKGGKTALDFLYPIAEAVDNLHIALREPKVVNIKDISFIMWPWGIFPKKEDKLLFMHNQKRPKKRIGLMHTALAQSKISSDGRRLRKGFSIATAKKTLEVFNLCYLLLGDIHEYQTFVKDKIIYSGSLYQTKFSESENKGVVLINTDFSTSRFIQIEETPKLKTVSKLKDINDYDFFKLSVGSKESALKILNKVLPENVVSIEHSLKRQKQEQLLESKNKIGLKVSLIPIMIKILEKQGVKDIRGAMEYMISMSESKGDFILP